MLLRASVGILTAPRRTSTIESCLDRLKRAGWDEPWVFAEPRSRIPKHIPHSRIVRRSGLLGAWPNWYLALHELYQRFPGADYFMMLEDDALLLSDTVRGIRTYVERTVAHRNDAAFLSLYCCKKYVPTKTGWLSLSVGWGYIGALALIMSKRSARLLLADPIVLNHRCVRGKYWGTRITDAVLGDWALRSHRPILAHHPSLLRHGGETSTLQNDYQPNWLRSAAQHLDEVEMPQKLWRSLQINRKNSDPKISCLMVTQLREPWATRAVQNFLRQSYVNRELVVVTDGGGAKEHCFFSWLDGFQDKRMVGRFYPGKHSLGFLRNRSVSQASGKILCQWDDDDLHSPDRLKIQWEKMRSRGAIASFLTAQMHYFFSERKIFVEDWADSREQFPPLHMIPGTIMIWKSFIPKYPESGESAHRGEDSVILETISRQGYPIEALEAEELMSLYVFHGENTWSKKHHALQSKRHGVSRKTLNRWRSFLEESVRRMVVKVPNGLRFCDASGRIVFEIR